MMFIESYEILAKNRTHYPLVMTNSSPWYSWPIEIDGLPGFTELKNGWIFPWRTVSHNHRVNPIFQPCWISLSYQAGHE